MTCWGFFKNLHIYLSICKSRKKTYSVVIFMLNMTALSTAQVSRGLLDNFSHEISTLFALLILTRIYVIIFLFSHCKKMMTPRVGLILTWGHYMKTHATLAKSSQDKCSKPHIKEHSGIPCIFHVNPKEAFPPPFKCGNNLKKT